MTNLAIVLRDSGRYTEAEQLLQKALQIERSTLGDEHPATLFSLNNLGIVYLDQERYGEAEQLFQQILEIRQRVLGEKHPDTLASMGNLAIVYGDQGRYNKAEELQQQVLEIRRSTSGDEHPDTLACMINLAEVFDGQGRYVDAERLDQEALAIASRTLGKEHPTTLAVINNLASVYQWQRRFTDAEKLHQQILEVKRRVLGDEHLDTLGSMHNLASVYLDQHRYTDAEKLYQQTLDVEQRVLGSEHPMTLRSMSNLANVYSHQERYTEAEQLDEQILEIRIRKFGNEHPETLTSMNNLAYRFQLQGRYPDAKKLYLQALEILQRTQYKEFPLTKTVKANLTSLTGLCVNRAWALATNANLEERNPAEAVRLAQLAVDLEPNKANNWDNLGVALCSHQEYERAVETFEKARQMRGGTDKFHQIFLAMSYWKVDRRDEALAEYLQHMNWLDEKRRPTEQYRFRDEAEEIIGTEAIAELLDRKVAEHPDDPSAYQVRATFYERRQQFDQAATDYLQVFDLTIAAGDSKPDPWWGPQKDLAVELAEKPEIDRRLQQLRPNYVSLKIGRLRAQAIHERWDQAGILLEELTEEFPGDLHPRQLLAAVKYHQGDLSGYRELCKLMLDRFANHNFMPMRERTVRISLLSPDLMQDRQDQLHDMIEATLDRSDEFPGHYGKWFLLTRSLLAYRERQYDTVPQWLEAPQKEKNLCRDVADLLLAMTEYQTGQRDQARQHYDEAVAHLEQSMSVQGSFSRRFHSLNILTAEQLRREAQALIVGEPAPLVAPKPRQESDESTKVLVGETAEPDSRK